MKFSNTKKSFYFNFIFSLWCLWSPLAVGYLHTQSPSVSSQTRYSPISKLSSINPKISEYSTLKINAGRLNNGMRNDDDTKSIKKATSFLSSSRVKVSILGLLFGCFTTLTFGENPVTHGQLPLVSITPVNPASAFLGLGGEKESIERDIKEIAKVQERVLEVQSQLVNRELRGGNEDSQVIKNYKKTYYDPSLVKMIELAPKLKLESSKQQERAQILPLLLKGHYIELDAAIAKKDAKEQLEEITEAADTINEFLTLAANKYTVPEIYVFNPSGYKPEKDYGPFACEFWGRERLAGSNKCVPKGEY